MSQFAVLKSYQKVYLLNAGIEPVIIRGEQIDEACRVLNLEGLDEQGLRAMRNAVVRFLANAKDECRDEETGEFIDGARFFQLSDNMSGITAVIDNIMWRKGYEH